LISQKTRTLLKKFGRLFPAVPLEVAFAWAGTFGETKDGLAYIGSIRDFRTPVLHWATAATALPFSVIAAEIIRDGSSAGRIATPACSGSAR